MLGSMVKVAAEEKADRSRAEDDRQQDEPELEAAEAKEHFANASERRVRVQRH
jgi:hypothetical protein